MNRILKFFVATLVAYVAAVAWIIATSAEAFAAGTWVAIDGDTIKLVEPVPGKKRPNTLRIVRVWGIDAPETDVWRAKCVREVERGEAAKGEVARLLAEAKRITIDRRDVREKYGRDLGGVIITQRDGARVSLADHMIAHGHARPWLGHGPKPNWCDGGSNHGEVEAREEEGGETTPRLSRRANRRVRDGEGREEAAGDPRPRNPVKPLVFARRGPAGVEVVIVTHDTDGTPRTIIGELTPERAIDIGLDIAAEGRRLQSRAPG